MDGLKSKNARQRTECLDIMSSFIEDFGNNKYHIILYKKFIHIIL